MKKVTMQGKKIKIQVTVTDKDIANGAKSATECPIALALGGRGACNGFNVVGTLTMHVSIRHPISHRKTVLAVGLPPKAVKFVERFDEGLPVKPFKFTLLAPQ